MTEGEGKPKIKKDEELIDLFKKDPIIRQDSSTDLKAFSKTRKPVLTEAQRLELEANERDSQKFKEILTEKKTFKEPSYIEAPMRVTTIFGMPAKYPKYAPRKRPK